jgi:hypothetical protein
VKNVNKKEVGFGIRLRISALLAALVMMTGLAFATFNTVTITSNLYIPSNCLFTTDIASFHLGSISQGTNVATTQNIITTTNSGNIASNILISGTTWSWGSNSMVVGQTRWARTATAWASATALTASPADTLIYVPSAAATNTITWAAAVPLYQAPGTYAQTISLSSSC